MIGDDQRCKGFHNHTGTGNQTNIVSPAGRIDNLLSGPVDCLLIHPQGGYRFESNLKGDIHPV